MCVFLSGGGLVPKGARIDDRRDEGTTPCTTGGEVRLAPALRRLLAPVRSPSSDGRPFRRPRCSHWVGHPSCRDEPVMPWNTCRSNGCGNSWKPTAWGSWRAPRIPPGDQNRSGPDRHDELGRRARGHPPARRLQHAAETVADTLRQVRRPRTCPCSSSSRTASAPATGPAPKRYSEPAARPRTRRPSRRGPGHGRRVGPGCGRNQWRSRLPSVRRQRSRGLACPRASGSRVSGKF